MSDLIPSHPRQPALTPHARTSLFQLAIRQPVTVVVMVIAIVLAGTISITRLPIAMTPTVDSTVITVNTFWSGASPAEIEQNVIDKQEERLTGLSNLRLMTSSSAFSRYGSHTPGVRAPGTPTRTSPSDEVSQTTSAKCPTIPRTSTSLS